MYSKSLKSILFESRQNLIAFFGKPESCFILENLSSWAADITLPLLIKAAALS